MGSGTSDAARKFILERGKVSGYGKLGCAGISDYISSVTYGGSFLVKQCRRKLVLGCLLIVGVRVRRWESIFHAGVVDVISRDLMMGRHSRNP